MACLSRAEVTLLKCVLLLLYLSGCLCQRDCTGVDCPLLNNCIEEVLESGACCATCVQTGCTCEGYQYYDCVNAGFKNGKVPEGDSYFVDYGSTECSCPEGGGRISCHFISCPDIPPNCIEVSEPADGCMQCERIGCVHDGQKYEAGHSFHIDPCRVCHCPTEGGKLMCYPVPNCDPHKVHKPMLASSTEDSATNRHYSDPHKFDHQGPVDHFSTPHRLSSGGSIPLFKPPLEKEEMEEYDYDPTDVRESYPDSLVFPTQAYPTNKVISVSRGADRADRTSTLHSRDRETKQELRERYGVHVHPTDREEVTESPVTAEQSTVKTSVQEDTTTAWWRSSSEGVMHAHSGSQSHISPHTGLESAMHAASSSDSVIFPRNRGSGSEKHPVYPHRSSASQQSRPVSKTHRQNVSDSVILPLHPLRGSESHMYSVHQARGAQSEGQPQKSSDWVNFPLHPQASSRSQMQLQGTVAPDDEEGVDEEEFEEEEDEEERIVTLQNVAEGMWPEGRDVPYDLQSVQLERGHGESDHSDPTSTTTTKTTAEPSTRSPRRPETQTTPLLRFTTTTQPPAHITPDESQSGKKPLTTLLNLHSEDSDKVEKQVKEPEEERTEDSPVFLLKPDGGK